MRSILQRHIEKVHARLAARALELEHKMRSDPSSVSAGTMFLVALSGVYITVLATLLSSPRTIARAVGAAMHSRTTYLVFTGLCAFASFVLAVWGAFQDHPSAFVNGAGLFALWLFLYALLSSSAHD